MDTKNSLLRLAEALRQQNVVVTARDSLSTPQTTTTQALPTTTSQANVANPNPGQTTQDNNIPPAAAKVDPNIPAPQAKHNTAVTNMNVNQILDLLTQQTDGSLQRTLTQQLHMLNTDSARQQLIFELPIKHADGVDVFDMRIHPDQQGHNPEMEQARPWTIMMAFDLDGLGPVRAQISLFNEKISTHWWAEQQQTVELFQQHLETLQNRLTHVGLEVDKVKCQYGIPKANIKQEQKSLYTDINLDEKV
jgi:hypothetical protein